MKQNQHQAGAKRSRAAKSTQARKTVGRKVRKPDPALRHVFGSDHDDRDLFVSENNPDQFYLVHDQRTPDAPPRPISRAEAVAWFTNGFVPDELRAHFPRPQTGELREVAQQLEDTRNMRFAVDLLMETALDQPEALALPTNFVCGVQEIDWHLHFKLGAALGAISPAHAEPGSEGHETTCCASSAIDTLLHLLCVFVIKENNLGSGREKDSLACGLVNLTSWATARLGRSIDDARNKSHARWQLLQRLADGDDSVTRADFEACGITPKAAPVAKGGAR